MLFEKLEQLEARTMLATVQLNDALVVNGIDLDSDGRLRAFDLQYVVAAAGGGSAQYSVDIFAQGVGNNTAPRQRIGRSVIETIQSGQSRTSSYTIRPDLIGWPQNGDARIHFSLELTRIGAETTQFEDPDLADISMETAAQDPGTNQIPLALWAFLATPNGNPNPLIEDAAVHFSMHAASTEGIGSVVVFLDRNGNGMLDSTDMFTTDADQRTTVKNASRVSGDATDGIYALDLVVNPDWASGNVSWGAVAISLSGNVSSIAFITTQVRQPVRVTAVSVQVLRGPTGFIDLTDAAQWYQPGTSAVYGDTIKLHPTLETFAAVADVFYIFDRDGSGGWTNGDIVLGRGDANFNYDLTFVLDQSWGLTPAHIIVDAVDVNTLWASQRATTTFAVTDRPAVTSVVIPPTAGVGQQMTLTATVSDSDPRVVTWFIDKLPNFKFDPGIDIDLGADFDGSNGWSRTIEVTLPMVGRNVIMAAARDGAGAWSPPTSGGAMWISAGPIVAFITTSPNTTSFAEGETVTLTAAISPGIPVTGVTFFLDRDGDGGWTPGTDVDLGFDTDAAGGWTKTFVVPTNWPAGGARFGANAFKITTFGDFATTTRNTIGFSEGPLVGSVTTPTPLTWGEAFTIAASDIRGGNVRAVSFFFDADRNGYWTPGLDTDLGADFDGSNGWSITPTAAGFWMPTTDARIIASAVDTSGNWGRGTQTDAITVYDRPRLANPTFTANLMNGPFIVSGTSGTVGASATASTNIVAFTFFVDIDHNGRWTPGTDIDLGATFVTAGTTRTATRNVTYNWGDGTFTVLADARDARGRWSGALLAQTLTITTL